MKILFFILVFSLSSFGQTFSSGWQKIPAGFTGNDFVKVYETLESTPVLKPKDEFETTSDYQKRISDLSKISFGENLNAESDLVFIYKAADSPVSAVKSKYDADKKILEISIEVKQVSDVNTANFKMTNYSAVDAAPLKYEQLKPYEGQNAYGTKRTIESSMMTYSNLAVSNISAFPVVKESYLEVLKFLLPLPAAKAKEVKANLSVLYAGKLTKPFFSLDANRLKPTVDKPRDILVGKRILVMNINEIWVFNNITGEILVKVKPKGQ